MARRGGVRREVVKQVLGARELVGSVVRNRQVEVFSSLGIREDRRENQLIALTGNRQGGRAAWEFLL